jgi:phosphoglycolate phosphatase
VRVRPLAPRRCRRGGARLKNWLVLFDVDGTLLLTHDEVYVDANRLALDEVYGTAAKGPDVPGDTAPAHTRRALRAAGLAEAEIDAGLERWCETFAARYVELLAASDTSHWELGPHAREAAAAVEHRALLTGNPAAVAHARMDRLGLADLFPRGQGAFGCDREDRIELFALARERAGGWPAERTVAVGDTPLDVSTSHAAGCRCVAVTTGRYGQAELADADLVIADLSDLEPALVRLS